MCITEEIEPVDRVDTYTDFNGKTFSHPYKELRLTDCIPITGAKKLTIFERLPAFVMNANGYPIDMRHSCVLSIPYWISKKDQIVGVGVKCFGYKGGNTFRLFRRDGEGNWTRTTRQNDKVRRALMRIMKVNMGKLERSELYEE